MSYRLIILVLLLMLLFSFGYIYFLYACEDDWCFIFDWQRIRFTNTFEDCVARSFPTTEIYPRQCAAGSKVFVEGRRVEAFTSKLVGTVTVGPTCPVVRQPPDPECADKPFEALIKIYAKSGNFVTSVSSDKRGLFSVDLAPGIYVLRPQSTIPGSAPFATAQEVVVERATTTTVTIQFDSGIR